MKSLITFVLVLSCFFSVSLLTETGGAVAEKNGVYIVYMGAAPSKKGVLRDDHAQLVNSLLKRNKNALVQSYKHGFSGFAAVLSETEAKSLAKKPGVVSVFPDPVLELHTTRSWDFLKLQTSVVITSNPNSDSDANSTTQDSGAIIGILDTGETCSPFLSPFLLFCYMLVEVHHGEGINFADIKKTPDYPIIYAKSAKKSGEDETSARNCDLDSMDQEIVKGKIVVCDNDNQLYALSEKKDEVKRLGGIGIVLIDDDSRTVASTFGSFPATVISKKDAPKLFSYINSTKTIPDGFTCPKDSSIDLISNINYPSIAITNFNEKTGRKVNRTLTNVSGEGKTVYTVTIDAPKGLEVQVVPDKLQFTSNGDKSSYQVSFSSATPLKDDVFGFITWSNGKYKVRSPFAVSSKKTGAADAEKDGAYIVYMGAVASKRGSLRDDHAQLQSSLSKRRKNGLLYNYKHGFSGFAAVLSAAEAHSLAEQPGVVSVFPDPVLKLHTTRSWDFLKFQSSVLIGSNPNSNSDSDSTSHDSDGEGINFADIQKSPVYPIIYAKSANRTGATDIEASNCDPDTMDQKLVKGKIVLCDILDSDYVESERTAEVKKLGGIGIVLIDDALIEVAPNFGTFPGTVISSKDADKLLSYINSTKNPVATILRTTSPTKHKPAPAIPDFSPRGPSTIPHLLKANTLSVPIFTKPTQTNNLRAPITFANDEAATPHELGAGEVSITGPLQPGLVYETTTIDYLNFLCYYGYNISTIKLIAKSIPDRFTCPKESNIHLISNINYTSIDITQFNEKEGMKMIRWEVTRTLTNVAGEEDKSIYNVSIDVYSDLYVQVVPDKLQFTRNSGLDVQVVPDKLQFTRNGQKLSYQNINKKIQDPQVIDPTAVANTLIKGLLSLL
ncbi:hypothetical protein CCACVL1_09097 [Corchorus capsularis]|uniref:Proteinase inhibitor I9 n=1 Tax=Corchorus capsularis TaxID=210143 RepID=A0A1R3IXS1_COCAP|nr:hypothetical protein CCACVL1_09097 [Corchorus capsularis]